MNFDQATVILVFESAPMFGFPGLCPASGAGVLVNAFHLGKIANEK